MYFQRHRDSLKEINLSAHGNNINIVLPRRVTPFNHRTEESKRKLLQEFGNIMRVVASSFAADEDCVDTLVQEFIVSSEGQKLFGQFVNDSVKIGKGVLETYQKIPPQSTFKVSMRSSISKYLTNSRSAEVMCCHRSTASRKLVESEDPLLKIRYGDDHTLRDRIGDEQQQLIVQFWLDNTEPDPYWTKLAQGQKLKSIPKEDRKYVAIRWLSVTEDELYGEYRQLCESRGLSPKCKEVFLKFKPFNIRKRPFRNGLCDMCMEFHRKKFKCKDYQGTTAYQIHKAVKDNQKKEFDDMLRNLKKGEAIILMDFGSVIGLPISCNESVNEWWNKDSVQDFILVLYIRDENDNIRHRYIHAVALSENEKMAAERTKMQAERNPKTREQADNPQNSKRSQPTCRTCLRRVAQNHKKINGKSHCNPCEKCGLPWISNHRKSDGQWYCNDGTLAAGVNENEGAVKGERGDELRNAGHAATKVFHGHVYVRRTFEYLFEQPVKDGESIMELFGVKRLMLWSDGGPAHFKTRRTLFMMKQFAETYRMPIEWHFFASNHGKGRCDAKHAVDKCKLIQYARKHDAVSSLNVYTRVIASVANTAFVFKVLGAESNTGYECTNFTEGIKKYHEWRFEPSCDIPIKCREKTGVGEFVLQQVRSIPSSSPIEQQEEREWFVGGLARDDADDMNAIRSGLDVYSDEELTEVVNHSIAMINEEDAHTDMHEQIMNIYIAEMCQRLSVAMESTSASVAMPEDDGPVLDDANMHSSDGQMAPSLVSNTYESGYDEYERPVKRIRWK